VGNVIEISGLGKQYRLGQVGTTTMADDLKRFWHSIRGKEDPFLKIGDTNDRTKKGNSDYVWALKNIDLSVAPGEVIGIIGKNGAGKSTLLKILSRTTTPTIGEYKIKGRVASLLEVGTGFHPDLTGRENVFLNGAILGMTKSEIKKHFDEIVDFSGVDRYIDTPVKRYSSGMYVRLAFAVAAHLNPEILIIDEVLAVGDLEFQEKCLGKMKSVSTQQGRTVLFVSHNMNAIKTLCGRSVFLKNGMVQDVGITSKVVDSYMFDGIENLAIRTFKPGEVAISGLCEIQETKLLNKDNVTSVTFDVTEPVIMELKYKVLNKSYCFTVHFYIKNSLGEVLFVSMDNKYTPHMSNPQEPGVYNERLFIDPNFFNEGNYTVEVLICPFPTTVDSKNCSYDNALMFSVTDKNLETGSRGNWIREWPSVQVRPDFKWQVKKVE
jgi:lipopolysaccharide transport system ATP-binding protein